MKDSTGTFENHHSFQKKKLGGREREPHRSIPKTGLSSPIRDFLLIFFPSVKT